MGFDNDLDVAVRTGALGTDLSTSFSSIEA